MKCNFSNGKQLKTVLSMFVVECRRLPCIECVTTLRCVSLDYRHVFNKLSIRKEFQRGAI